MEVRNIELHHLDFDRQMLHVVQGKGQKDRYVPLSEHLIRGLKTFISVENPTHYLFNGNQNRNIEEIMLRLRSAQVLPQLTSKILIPDTVSAAFNGSSKP